LFNQLSLFSFQIVDWLHVAQQFRPDIVELQVIGRSFEGRPMHLVKVIKTATTTYGNDNN